MADSFTFGETVVDWNVGKIEIKIIGILLPFLIHERASAIKKNLIEVPLKFTFLLSS